jgi:hypothetical protein
MVKRLGLGCLVAALSVSVAACGKPGQVNPAQAPVEFAGQPAGDGRTLLVPGSTISLDHVGAYVWKSDPIPGMTSKSFKSFGMGRVIEGGSALIVDDKLVPLDTPDGLVLTFSSPSSPSRVTPFYA